jgi:hypothetical protein
MMTMQDRYAGDIGDYIKLALLRHLSVGYKLGIAWYLHPDERHNKDGKHTKYSKDPGRWRHLDPELFDALHDIVKNKRSVRALEKTGILGRKFSNEQLISKDVPWRSRAKWRADWFDRVLGAIEGAELVFADPDNGLVDDDPKRRNRKIFDKQIPLSEAKALARGRTAIIYHHNTRFKGGHDPEVDRWLASLGDNTVALRANAYSCRTFFIINPDQLILDRVTTFCHQWADHRVRLHERSQLD